MSRVEQSAAHEASDTDASRERPLDERNSGEACVRELERRRQHAMLAADVLILDELLDKDLVYIHSNGVEDTKAHYLADLATGAVVYRSLAFDEVRVKAVSDAMLVVVGLMIASITKASGDVSVRSRYTAIWQRPEAHWRLVLFQGTKTTG